MASNSSGNDGHELRTDFLGRTVVLTPARAGRPHEMGASPAPLGSPADCYFCPGNESKTPPEIERVPSQKNTPWSLRCFPNAFPAFSRSFPKAFGSHEIIVETPLHGRHLSELDEAAMARYLLFLAKRVRSQAAERKLKAVALFKNEGLAGGASLAHAHTQLVGLPIVPPELKKIEKVCKSSCPFCLLSVDDQYSKIIEDGPFLALAPWAPRFNHEVWIVPRAHTPSLTDLDENSISALARTLRSILRAQDSSLNYPAYNLIFHLAPLRQKNFHFHLELCPRIGQWAGFELGFGAVMNSVRPEETARLYKDWIRTNS